MHKQNDGDFHGSSVIKTHRSLIRDGTFTPCSGSEES